MFFVLFVTNFASAKQASIVIDYSNKETILLEHNAHVRCYPASLTKLMTLYILLSELRAGKIKLNTQFRVSKYAAMQAPSKLHLKIGSRITVADIITSLLVVSANDVAVVAAEGVSGDVITFVKKMNAMAKKLKMHSTHFENPSGLPNSSQFTTAADISKLGIAIFKNFKQYWNFFSKKKFDYNGKTYNTHCKILRWYAGSDGAKTGYIAASGFNLFVTAQKYNKNGHSKRIFVVVMGGTSSKTRDLYAAYLMNKAFGTEYNFTTTKIKQIPIKIKPKSKQSHKHNKFGSILTKPKKLQEQRAKTPTKQNKLENRLFTKQDIYIVDELQIENVADKKVIEELYIDPNDEED